MDDGGPGPPYGDPVDPGTALARSPAGPRRSEFLVTAGLLLWAVLEAVAAPRPLPLALGLAAAWSLPTLWMRVAPLPSLAFLLGTFLVDALLAGAPPAGAMPFPTVLLLTFACGLWVRRTAASVAGGVAASATVLVVQLFGYYTETVGPQLAVAVFFVAGAWTAGRLLRRRAQDLVRAEQDRARASALADAAEREAATAAREAVARERAAIARELHDVVAHAVSVVAVQAGAAQDLVGTDPERARLHIGHARDGARRAMVEMRRMLEVLDPYDEAREDLAPLPGTGRIGDLVAATRDAGTPVTLHETGDAAPLPPAVDLAAYRVVQESLTNARRHAPGIAVTVLLEHGHDAIGIEIRNGPGGRPDPVSGGTGTTGRGLPGMAERVRVFGGTLRAGPDDDGGFTVRARLPRSTTATAP